MHPYEQLAKKACTDVQRFTQRVALEGQRSVLLRVVSRVSDAAVLTALLQHSEYSHVTLAEFVVGGDADALRDLIVDQPKLGEVYCLLSMAWIARFRSAVAAGTSPLPPIDNGDLLLQDGVLPPRMRQGFDFCVISQTGWNVLLDGLGGPGPMIWRRAVECFQGVPPVKMVCVDPFPVSVTYFLRNWESDEVNCISISGTTTWENLISRVCAEERIIGSEYVQLVVNNTTGALVDVPSYLFTTPIALSGVVDALVLAFTRPWTLKRRMSPPFDHFDYQTLFRSNVLATYAFQSAFTNLLLVLKHYRLPRDVMRLIGNAALELKFDPVWCGAHASLRPHAYDSLPLFGKVSPWVDNPMTTGYSPRTPSYYSPMTPGYSPPSPGYSPPSSPRRIN